MASEKKENSERESRQRGYFSGRVWLLARAFYLARIRGPARLLFEILGSISILLLILEFGFYYPTEWKWIIQGLIESIVYYLVGFEILTAIFAGEGFLKQIRRKKVEAIVIFAVILQWLFRDSIIRFLGLEGIDAKDAALVFLSLSQVFLMVSTLLHLLRSARFSRFLRFSPSLVFLLSFALVIGSGSMMLLLPRSHTGELAPVDAVFIAISATSVTGLSTLDVGTAFTFMGQIILLGLIQIGGLGLMTLTSFFSYFLAGRSSMQNQLIMRDLLSEESVGRVRGLVREIALFTFGIESIGAFYLYITTPAHLFENHGDRVFSAIFHSVSAFCNAGFSLYPRGLADLNGGGEAYLSGIMSLIVLGGLGFPVLSELFKRMRDYRTRRKHYSVTTRLILIMNGVLLSTATVAYFFLEAPGTLADFDDRHRFFHSVFYAITLRTAGFNTTDVGAIGIPMIFLSFFFMWVGASPASTGGGIKTSTLAVAIIHVINQIRGKDNVEIFKKTIPGPSISRAYSTVILSLFVIFTGIFLLVIIEGKDFVDIAFEVVSAFGTVGLSRGITPGLQDVSKLILGAIMLMGRVGILTFLMAFVPQADGAAYRYPSEYVIVG